MMADPALVASTLLDGMDCLALVVDSEGRVLFANRVADERLGASVETPRKVWAELRSVAAAAIANREERARVVLRSVPGGNAWRGLIWHLEHGRAGVVLWPAGISEGDAAVLASRLRLGPSDARLAVRILAGKSNAEIADAFRLNINTVKARIARLFRRVAVDNRGAFVALAMAHLREEQTRDR
jgi:DNA-binding CsgD family transcriptional regulator